MVERGFVLGCCFFFLFGLIQKILGTGCLWACSSVWLERTPDKREVTSSNLVRPTTFIVSDGGFLGDVAQLGEHRLCKPGVTGSSPVISTTG
jgi:hypothetical protein